MPSAIDVQLSRNAHGLEQGAAPSPRTPRAAASLWCCPKPGALLGVEKLELPFPATSRCPCPAGTFPFASFRSSGSRAACLLLSHPRLQHLKGQEKAPFQDVAEVDPLWFVSLVHCWCLSRVVCPWWVHRPAQGTGATSLHLAASLQWDVFLKTLPHI